MKKISITRKIISIFVGLMMCLILQSVAFANLQDPKNLLGKAAPAIGNLTSYSVPVKNSVNIIIFWNSKNESAIYALEYIQDIYNQFKSKGLLVYGINDSNEKSSILSSTNYQIHITFPLATGSSAVKAAGLYEIKSVPVVFLINKACKVEEVYEGYANLVDSDLSRKIQELL